VGAIVPSDKNVGGGAVGREGGWRPVGDHGHGDGVVGRGTRRIGDFPWWPLARWPRAGLTGWASTAPMG
jgi:hypothetical protein